MAATSPASPSPGGPHEPPPAPRSTMHLTRTYHDEEQANHAASRGSCGRYLYTPHRTLRNHSNGIQQGDGPGRMRMAFMCKAERVVVVAGHQCGGTGTHFERPPIQLDSCFLFRF
jgi:hypothetical protein